MYRHDRLANLREHRHRHGTAADVAAGSPLRGHRAAQRQRAIVVDLAAAVGYPCMNGGGAGASEPQPTLDDRPAHLRINPRGIASPAEEQPETGHHHRLAGAGLAGDGVQPRREVELGLPDEDEVLDAQPSQHPGIVA